jgi:hypothetical protein
MKSETHVLLTTNYFAQTAFFVTGDFVMGGFSDDLGSLLDAGVKVALINGDRDFRCNCKFELAAVLYVDPRELTRYCSGFGGENVSLTIDYADKAAFAAAGYADIATNATYVGGLVRQYGGFSFSRVFEAGHQGKQFPPL